MIVRPDMGTARKIISRQVNARSFDKERLVWDSDRVFETVEISRSQDFTMMKIV